MESEIYLHRKLSGTKDLKFCSKTTTLKKPSNNKQTDGHSILITLGYALTKTDYNVLSLYRLFNSNWIYSRLGIIIVINHLSEYLHTYIPYIFN